MSHIWILSFTLISSVRSLSNITNISAELSSVQPSTIDCNAGNRTKLYFSPAIDLHVPLVIESSSKASHLIVSYILKDLLTKHLCYQNVTVKVRDNRRDIQEIQRSFRPSRTSCGVTLSRDCFPEAMVNLEVWQPVGFPSISVTEGGNPYIDDIGPLGAVITPGLFIPNSIATAYWSQSKLTIDHWKIFELKRYAQKFHSNIDGRSFETTRCGLTERCARLLILDNLHHYFLEPVSKFINATKLWIAPRVIKSASTLDRYLLSFSNSSSAPYPLVLNWFPSPVTLKYRLTRLTPSCSDQWRSYDPSCQVMQEKQVNKWIWRNLSVYAPHAVTTIRRMNLSQQDYESLLRKAATLKGKPPLLEHYKTIASEWIKDNHQKWKKWLPEVPAKTTLTIAGLFPTDPFFNNYDLAVKEIFDYVNKRHLADAPFRLNLEVYNVSNNAGSLLYSYNKLNFMCNKSRKLVGIIASTQADVTIPLAYLSRRYKSIVISPTVESLSVSNEEANKNYPYFFRTIPDHSDYSEYLISLFKQFKWRRLALFRQNGLIFNKESLSSSLDVIYDMKKEESQLTLPKVMEALKIADREKRARILVVNYKRSGTALFMCAAVKLNMTPERGFVWILPSWMNGQFDLSFLNCSSRCGCSANETLALKTFFVLSPHVPRNSPIRRRSDPFLNLLLRMGKLAPQMKFDLTIKYTYDAVMSYAEALKKLIGKGEGGVERYIAGDKYLRLLSSVRFPGSSGGNFSYTSKNIRSSMIWAFYQHTPSSKSFLGFISIKWESKNRSKPFPLKRMLLLTKMFPGNKMPSDGSSKEKCDWPFFARYLSCDDSRSWSISLIALGVIFFVFFGFLTIYFTGRWYIKKVNARCPQPFSELQEYLKECEIQRSMLLLQYPLGEGAFGTVYYGEMKIDNVWTGIAAKVLREGATSDERREFLLEAIKMRDFDHPNVMSVIGVVTTAPNYVNVMEFMLLGDLRKYLLTRHNVAKNSPEHEDICPSTLTNMALDIARGLEYLKQKRLVHRDLACRNCLVDKQRRIKIGDFGMTRLVNDAKGYYRFDRPGILPVRWMAPESIQSGIFNFFTDVWSYGVVLYEIVTFGNQPYRGRTNEEVIESMKRCNDSLSSYLVKPEERIPGLYDLMLSCWSFRAEERPVISFVIQRLEVNPDCVRPCLDEAPPHPGENRPRGPGADRIAVFSTGDLPVCRGTRGSVMCGMASTGSSDRTRVASGNRVSTDMRHCDSVGRVNNLTSSSFTNNIASRLGFFRENTSSKWYSGSSNSNPKRHTCSSEFLSYSRHHSGDQEISTVSDPHGYQMEFDTLVLTSTVRTFAANSCNSGYGGLPNEVHRDGERRSSSGGQRDDDDLDADQQTLLKMSRT